MTVVNNILDKLWVNLFHQWGTLAYYEQTTLYTKYLCFKYHKIQQNPNLMLLNVWLPHILGSFSATLAKTPHKQSINFLFRVPQFNVLTAFNAQKFVPTSFWNLNFALTFTTLEYELCK